LDPKINKEQGNRLEKEEKKAEVANVAHLSAICRPNLMGFVGLV
jgi:hypothetical protein